MRRPAFPLLAVVLFAAVSSSSGSGAASAVRADSPTLTVELRSASGATVGSVVFTQGMASGHSRVALHFLGLSYVPNGGGEVIVRPGTCVRPTVGRGDNISAGWPIAYSLDTLMKATWAVE